jgi:hypothetical protein
MPPSVSVLPAALTEQVRTLQLGAANTTVGGWLPAGSVSETFRVVEADLPQPSVVVSVIV